MNAKQVTGKTPKVPGINYELYASLPRLNSYTDPEPTNTRGWTVVRAKNRNKNRQQKEHQDEADAFEKIVAF